MRPITIILVLAVAAWSGPAAGAEIASAYTELEPGAGLQHRRHGRAG